MKSLTVPVARVFRPLLDPARYKGAHGGRGSGKSHFFAGQAVVQALGRPGLRIVCIREIQRSLGQSVKLLIEDKIKSSGMADAFRMLERHTVTPGGGIIIYEGMQNHTSDSIKSLEGFDVAYVEEAQSLSKRSLELLRPTIRKDGSELWFSWNPKQATDPIDVFLRQSPPDTAVIVQANWRDNPWLPSTLREDMEHDRATNPDRYGHVWEGEYEGASEARVFRNWRVEEFEAPPSAIFRFGADWGFAADPTVLVRCYIDGRRLYVDHAAWKIGCEIDQTPRLFDTVPGARRWPITADSARPETVSYMRRAGFRVVPAIKGPGSIEDGVEFLRSYEIIVHPRCQHVADELKEYAYKTDPLTGVITPVLEDRYNHTIDALRYALEALMMAERRKPVPVAPSRNPPDLSRWRPSTHVQESEWKTA